MSETPITVNIPTGAFFFRDSPHYLFGLKKSVLLEDIKRYDYTFEERVGQVYDMFMVGSEGFNLDVGYGSAYGAEYGGIVYENQNNITIKITEDDEGEQDVIGPFTQIGFNADLIVDNPQRDLINLDAIGREIEISYVSRDNTPNCFGLNKGKVSYLHAISTGFGTSRDFSGVSIDGQVSSVGRSYRLTVLDLDNDHANVHDQNYDVYISTTDANSLKADLTTYNDPQYCVILTTNDEPKSNSSIFKDEVIALGGTEEKFDAIKHRGAYILIVVPGSDPIEMVSPHGDTSDLIPIGRFTYIEARVVLENREVRLDDDIEHTVTIMNSSPYDGDGNLVTNDLSLFYSVETTRSGTEVSLADIENLHEDGLPLEVPVTDPETLPYLREGDHVFVDLPNILHEVATVEDLPTSNAANRLAVYLIKETGEYYVVNSELEFVTKPSFLTLTPRTVYLGTVTENSQGNVHQGEYMFVTPPNWSDSDFFDSIYDNSRLLNYVVKYWDGLPPGCIVYTNKSRISIKRVSENKLLIDDSAYNMIEEVIPAPFTANHKLYDDHINVASGAFVTYNGVGKNYTANMFIPLSDFTITYELLERELRNSPVVITDLLSSDIDDPEFTNVQFKIDDNNLVFNRADNKIVNPTFLKESSIPGVIPGWDVTPDVTINYVARRYDER